MSGLSTERGSSLGKGATAPLMKTKVMTARSKIRGDNILSVFGLKNILKRLKFLDSI